MDTQEDLIKKQEEERQKALEAQATLSQKLLDDHRKQAEQIQQQQEQMAEIQQRQQKAIDDAVIKTLETQVRERELERPSEGEGGKHPLEARRERMEVAANKCHETANQAEEAAKQLQTTQEQQLRLTELTEDQNKPDDARKAAENLLVQANEKTQKLQDEYEKLTKDFASQSKVFDAYQNGFGQEHEQLNQQLTHRQEEIQAANQRQAQEALDKLNKETQDKLNSVANDLEKRQSETLTAKWQSPGEKEGVKPEDQKPNGQQFEDQLKKTGELNEKLAEIEKQRGMHLPYQEAQPQTQEQGRPKLADDEQNSAPKTENIHAQSDQLAKESNLRPVSAGDMDGRSVRTPSITDEKVSKVQDNWSQHERQQQKLISEIREHEKVASESRAQLSKSIDEHGDMSKQKPKDGCTPDELKQFNALKQQQQDLAGKVNHADNQIGRKSNEFKVNESDFQRQSWDRVAKMAELSGDKTLQQKAEMKSEALKNQVDTMNQRLDQKYGPKPEEKPAYDPKKVTIMSDAEVNNKLKPVSPGGISDKLVDQAKEQQEKIKQQELARRQEQEQHRLTQGKP